MYAQLMLGIPLVMYACGRTMLSDVAAAADVPGAYSGIDQRTTEAQRRRDELTARATQWAHELVEDATRWQDAELYQIEFPVDRKHSWSLRKVIKEELAGIELGGGLYLSGKGTFFQKKIDDPFGPYFAHIPVDEIDKTLLSNLVYGALNRTA